MSPSKAQIFLDLHHVIAPISPLLFGGFAGHMGRSVYEVIRPWLALGRRGGLRRDVIAALREQGYAVVATRGAISSAATTGSTASGPNSNARVARPRLAVAGNESIWHERVYGILRRHRRRSHAGRQHGHRRHPVRGRSRRLLQRAGRHVSGRTCTSTTATPSPTTCATGASATKWTVPGRSGTWTQPPTATRRLEAAKMMKC